ncbi:hypothetical protein [Helicobacter cappadocius]|uniref:Uncharacterized protein n=1 Tax=Helicobacter cappadocius TaxID=3063998 RepID=A0AA90PIY1_9HELI|nr:MULTISPECIES: hypothetical protein [unclassified Helicobacter]MDO7252573.1 hypothetical protein [Helicobacter sp. faydin-H75]MDP2538440.1 hypothetical protein [Helicobacter sp. faydin-H76]
MKFFLLIIYFFCQMAMGIDFISIEPKIGIAPYQNFESKVESETLDNFFDYGVDIYSSIPKMKNFEFGIGGEIRRLNPLLIDKKNVGLFFALLKFPTLLDTKFIIRLGFLQNIVLENSFYYGLGIEKSFFSLVFQVLFDDMQLKSNNIDLHYRSVVFKMGIKI